MPEQLTDKNFKAQISSHKGIALVDFWAQWCGPCKLQGPIVEAVAQHFADKPLVRVFKVDVDANPAVAQDHSIMSIPTLIIFKNGAPVEELVGLRQREALIDLLNKHLAAA